MTVSAKVTIYKGFFFFFFFVSYLRFFFCVSFILVFSTVSDSLRIVRACHVLGCIFLAAAMAASGYLAFGKAGNRIASILDKVLVGAISLAGKLGQ